MSNSCRCIALAGVVLCVAPGWGSGQAVGATTGAQDITVADQSFDDKKIAELQGMDPRCPAHPADLDPDNFNAEPPPPSAAVP